MITADLVIKNGYVVSEKLEGYYDIGIKGEKVTTIQKKINNAKKIIDAKDKFIFPGMIDVHTHFQLKAYGSVSVGFENGTKAAIYGGVTTIIDFAIPESGQSLTEAVALRIKEAEGNIYTDYSLHCQIIKWYPELIKEIQGVLNRGITSFKIFMPRTQNWYIDDFSLYNIMKTLSEFDAVILVHAENADLVDGFTKETISNYGKNPRYFPLSRPVIVESEAISRAIFIAKNTGVRLYIVHLTTGDGLELIKKAKSEGIKVKVETCPQYLLLTSDVFQRKDAYLFCACPPIKSNSDRNALWNGIADGSIDVIATDTCAFTKKQKKLFHNDFTKIPFGLPGVETMFPLIFSEGYIKRKLPLKHIVKLCSTNPAKIFGLYPKKGAISVGSDADILIYSPDVITVIDYKKLQTNCEWSPYQGMEIIGKPYMVILRGKIVLEGDKFCGDPGYGKFIKRSTKTSLMWKNS